MEKKKLEDRIKQLEDKCFKLEALSLQQSTALGVLFSLCRVSLSDLKPKPVDPEKLTALYQKKIADGLKSYLQEMDEIFPEYAEKMRKELSKYCQ